MSETESLVMTIEVEREADGEYFASWTSADGKVAGSAEYSPTIVGALANLCAVLIKVDEDDSVERRKMPPRGMVELQPGLLRPAHITRGGQMSNSSIPNDAKGVMPSDCVSRESAVPDGYPILRMDPSKLWDPIAPHRPGVIRDRLERTSDGGGPDNLESSRAVYMADVSYLLAALARAEQTIRAQPALPDIELVSAQVHDAWMASKAANGVTSRCAEDGEELMAPYDHLSERAKELDRGTVRAVYAAIQLASRARPATGAPETSPETK